MCAAGCVMRQCCRGWSAALRRPVYRGRPLLPPPLLTSASNDSAACFPAAASHCTLVRGGDFQGHACRMVSGRPCSQFLIVQHMVLFSIEGWLAQLPLRMYGVLPLWRVLDSDYLEFWVFWGVANLLLSKQGDCLQPPLWMYGELPLWRVLDSNS